MVLWWDSPADSHRVPVIMPVSWGNAQPHPTGICEALFVCARLRGSSVADRGNAILKPGVPRVWPQQVTGQGGKTYSSNNHRRKHICDKCFALRVEGGVNGSTKMGSKGVEEEWRRGVLQARFLRNYETWRGREFNGWRGAELAKNVSWSKEQTAKSISLKDPEAGGRERQGAWL